MITEESIRGLQSLFLAAFFRNGKNLVMTAKDKYGSLETCMEDGGEASTTALCICKREKTLIE